MRWLLVSARPTASRTSCVACGSEQLAALKRHNLAVAGNAAERVRVVRSPALAAVAAQRFALPPSVRDGLHGTRAC